MKVPILMGERITAEHYPKTREEIEEMEYVPYASDVGSLIYVMVFT